ncbi:glycosyltransferase [Larkinella bovis]|uniref:Glycosyltransferase n=1 Tax=Larkinella bovis TaxID=683041 RepID=A0ABW0IIE4_9BACT
MRLLHVISGLDPQIGGTSQALRTVIKGLAEHSVMNEVVCLDDPQATYLQELTFPIYALGPARTPWQYAPRFLPWLNSQLAEYDAVLVHGLWHFHTHAVYQVWRSLKTGRPALYVMPHGMLDPWFQQVAGRRLKALRNWFFWKATERNIINHTDGVLFTSETEKKLAKLPFKPYAPRSENVVGLGVETPPAFTAAMGEAFREKCPGLPDGFLLFLSRLHVKKGVDLLVKAYRRLKKEGVKLPKLVVAGPGLDTPFGQRVVQLAGGDNDIRFPGMLSGDAKWGAFYQSAAFVLPSHQENFGIAVVEALACGKPVLISDQVNIWWEIERAGAGLIGPDSEEGIYTSLKQWTTLTASQKAQMAQQAVGAFENHFTVLRASEKIVTVLNRNKSVVTTN